MLVKQAMLRVKRCVRGQLEHLLPNSWVCLGCTWAGCCSSGVFGGPSCLCRTDCLQAGSVLYRSRKEPFSVRVSEIGVFFSLWLDQSLDEWCQRLSYFWKMGKIGLNFCCRGEDQTLQLPNLVPYYYALGEGGMG